MVLAITSLASDIYQPVGLSSMDDINWICRQQLFGWPYHGIYVTKFSKSFNVALYVNADLRPDQPAWQGKVAFEGGNFIGRVGDHGLIQYAEYSLVRDYYCADFFQTSSQTIGSSRVVKEMGRMD